jgi:hypothetical protein
MIPNIFVDCNDWGIPRGLMVADENFSSPYSIDIFYEPICSLNFFTMITDAARKLSSFTEYRTRMDYFRQYTLSST